ncbi:MAG: lamin tail domain-containing protein [Bacteroidota bacterium]
MKYFFTTLFISTSLLIRAQEFYDMDNIQTIEVTFAESNWDRLMDDAYARDAGYILAQSVTINGETFDSVGVKYKGNSSYSSNQVKNPWHIELDTYKEQEYDGYTDIKLANGTNDPSFLRDVLGYQIIRQYMDAPLANYANLYVNGNLIGLYANTESVSRKFANRRFGSNDNTYVKCSPPGGAGPQSRDYPNLVYMGQDSTDYYDSYEPKSDGGWQALIDLCDTLGNHIDAIEEILDVDRALWMLAFDNVIVNLDSYIGQFAQNYYLYRSDYGQFLPVVWDLNESFGVFSGTGTINLNNTTSKQRMTHLLHASDANWPLVRQLLSVPTYKRMYLAHFKTILLENFDNNAYLETALTLQATIDAAVRADPNKFYSYNDFINNLTSDVRSGGGGGPGGGRTSPGITTLMDGRTSYLLGLSDFTQTAPTISDIAVSNEVPALNETITITTSVTDANEVFLAYRNQSVAPFTKVPMFDDGAHNDGAANDGIYGVELEINSTTIQYYIYAENNNAGMFSPQRAQHEFYTINASINNSIAGDLVINEFMASNDVTVADQDGEFDDWIELYNNTNASIDLTGYALSDDATELTQWTFPEGTTIAANDYLIVWADGDEEQAGLHANFGLSASGETIYLVNATGEIVDAVTYEGQTTDISFGRFPNGTGDFQTMNPTFNAQNISSTVDLCADNGGDADGDGVCADEDCDDNDASIGAQQDAGTTCDDGDETTVNDLIQEDGCTCAGTTMFADSDLVINELMASNEATAADQDGEFDDWIELYNNGTESINLEGYALTDDGMDLTQWLFPAGTVIEPNGYLIIWADNDEDQAGLHANFRLSASGESILLVNPTGTIIDIVSYVDQMTDVSHGRFPNGTGDFQDMRPTFNAENEGTTTSIDAPFLAATSLMAYPNPVAKSLFLEINEETPKERAVFIYNLNGTVVYQNSMTSNTTIDVANWAAGMYIVRVEDAFLKIVKN